MRKSKGPALFFNCHTYENRFCFYNEKLFTGINSHGNPKVVNTEIFHLKVECTLKVELLWARIEHDKSLHDRKSRFFIKTWNCHYYSFNNTAYQSRLTTLLEIYLSVFSWKKIPLVVKNSSAEISVHAMSSL